MTGINDLKTFPLSRAGHGQNDISSVTPVVIAEQFGEPTLIARNNGDAVWSRPGISPYHQKSGSGWLANLYGGVQSGWDDFAAIYIPVNEMRLVDLNSALWSYYMTEAESFSVGMVIWIHDPTDFDKRAEITQLASVAGLEKGSGWNAHELDITTDQFFYMGENVGSPGLTADPPNYYGLNDFQADIVFRGWTIYRISFDYGWQTSDNEFKDVWVADIKLNGIVISLKPDSGGSGRIGQRFKTADSGDPAFALAPKTPFKLLSFVFHLDAAATQETLTVKVDAGRVASKYDTLLVSEAMAGITDIVKTWEGGLDLKEDDEVDVAWTNTDGANYGLTMTYQTVF